jgi:hypothetical protein
VAENGALAEAFWYLGMGGRASIAVEKLAIPHLRKRKRPRWAALFGLISFDLLGRIFSLPPIIRIPNPALKPAKYL